jgi:uncharacterized phage protein (TIGR01671 family)
MEKIFRAWNKIHKYMLYDGGHMDLAITITGELYCPDSYYMPVKDEFILMQYIGKTDKNGVKLFESDVVKCRYGKSGYQAYEIVELSMYGAIFRTANNWNYCYRDLPQKESIEKIGDKYSKPELLKGV